MWVAADGRAPVVLQPGFQSRKRLSVIVFNTQVPVIVDIVPQKLILTATYCVETVPPGVIKSIRQQRPIVDTSTTLLLHDNAIAHKAKVTVTFLTEHNIQVLFPPPPPVPTWLQVTLG